MAQVTDLEMCVEVERLRRENTLLKERNRLREENTTLKVGVATSFQFREPLHEPVKRQGPTPLAYATSQTKDAASPRPALAGWDKLRLVANVTFQGPPLAGSDP